VLVAALPAFANVSNPKIAQALLLLLWSYLHNPDSDFKWEQFLEVPGTVSLTIGSGKRVATEVWGSVEARLKTPAGELGLKRERVSPGVARGCPGASMPATGGPKGPQRRGVAVGALEACIHAR